MPDKIPEYEIKVLEDFLDVPEEHLKELLTDLVDFYHIARPLRVMAAALGDKSGLTVPKLIFKPDGKGDHTLTLTSTGKPVTNKAGQPIGDFPGELPTEVEFNSSHATPLGYGDEDDWLIVTKAIGKEKALELIQKELRDNYGMDEAFIPQNTDDLISYDIGYGYDHDSYHYSEGSYWICSKENLVTKRWEGWGVATQ